LTEGEAADTRGLLESIAARWAAKEAAMKALGIGIGQIDPTDIEVVKMDDVPTLRFHRGAKSRADELGLTDWSLSLSHTKDVAIAFVVALGSHS
jgi:holo-[acyl-carrier protein] synthase